MRVLRKLVAFLVYAAVLLPVSDYRLPSWMKAVEITSTSLDRTMRRRKSSVESERLARYLKLIHSLDGDLGEVTWRWRA